MIYYIIFLSAALGMVSYFCYTLFVRVEKLSKNQAIMVEWCDTLRQNEEQLLKDMKQLRYEISNAKENNNKR